MLDRHAMLNRILPTIRRVLRLAPPNDFHRLVRATRPDPTEFECDRYIRARPNREK